MKVFWKRRVQRTNARIREPNSQGNYIIQAANEDGCAVSTSRAAYKKNDDADFPIGLQLQLTPILSAQHIHARPHGHMHTHTPFSGREKLLEK
jgi:hypothetical protein